MAVETDPLREEDQTLEVEIESISVVEKPLEERLDYETGKELHTKILDKLKARRDYSVEHCEERLREWNRVKETCSSSTSTSPTSPPWRPRAAMSQLWRCHSALGLHPGVLRQPPRLADADDVLFSARNPLIQREAEAEDVFKAKMMETILAYDVQADQKASPRCTPMFQDSISFGTGINYDSWRSKRAQVRL